MRNIGNGTSSIFYFITIIFGEYVCLGLYEKRSNFKKAFFTKNKRNKIIALKLLNSLKVC